MELNFSILFTIALAIVLTAKIVRSAKSDIDMSQIGKWQLAMIAVANTLILAGLLGFLSFFLASAGGLKWLPEPFEWPMGSTDNILVTSDGTHIARNSASSRVQIYGDNLSFQRGWWIEDFGGVFKLAPVDEQSFYVYTARGSQRYHYDLFGNLISAQVYESPKYSELPSVGQNIDIPTPIYLRPLTHPFASLALAMFGSFFLWAIRQISEIDKQTNTPSS